VILNLSAVMAGLIPAIYALLLGKQDVDARYKPAHDVERADQNDRKAL
jgi:hypothetical protein